MYLVTVRKLTYYSAGFLLKFSHSDTAIGCFFLPTHSFSVLESRCNQVKRTLGTWGFFSKESSISFFILILVPSGNFWFSFWSFFIPWDWDGILEYRMLVGLSQSTLNRRLNTPCSRIIKATVSTSIYC